MIGIAGFMMGAVKFIIIKKEEYYEIFWNGWD